MGYYHCRLPTPRPWGPRSLPGLQLEPVGKPEPRHLPALPPPRTLQTGPWLPQGQRGSGKSYGAALPRQPHLSFNLISILSRSIFIFSCGELVPCSFQIE